MKNVTKIKHAGMLRIFVVAALVLLFAAAGVGAVSAWEDSTLNNYWVNFSMQGHGAQVTNESLLYGSKVTEPAKPTESRFTFNGWYKDSKCTNAWDFSSDTVPAENTILYANWTANATYTVTYDGNDNTSGTVPVDSEKYESGAEVKVLGDIGNLSKTGFNFNGWNIGSAEGELKQAGATFQIEKNTTLYANWTAVAKYNITNTSVVNGTVTADKPTAAEGEIINVTAVNAAGYHFVEWNVTNITGGQIPVTETNNFTMPAEDVNVGAEFAANVYNVSFNATGGSGEMQRQQFIYDVAQNLSKNNFTNGTYVFAGWATELGGAVVYADEESVVNLSAVNESVVELFAVWETSGSLIKNATASAADYMYGAQRLTPSLDITVPGAVFYYSDSATDLNGKAWDSLTGTTLGVGTYYVFAKADGQASKRSTFNVTKAKHVTPAEPTVSVDETTGKVSVTINSYDEKKQYAYSLGEENYVTVLSNPFDLSGLEKGKQYTLYLRVSENINYTNSESASASFTTPAEAFTVSYNANGGVGSVSQLSENGKVTLQPTSIVSRNGYTADAKWYTKADGTGTEYAAGQSVETDMTLYAKWTGNLYTITFNNEGAVTTQTLKYGDNPTKLDAVTPAKLDSTFAGWAATQNGVVVYTDKQKVQNLGNITLYAVWVANPHTVKVTIENQPTGSSLMVKLMRGNATIETKTGTDISFPNVPSGTYNLVAEAGDKIVTKMFILTETSGEEYTIPITFPEANVNSKVEISEKENTPAVVVGKLDDEAEAKAENGKKVTITLAVEAKVEAEVADNAGTEVMKVQDEISKIKTKVKTENPKVAENPMQFLEITVKKKVEDKEDVLPETSNVIELVVPYDFTGKQDVKVYRVHDGISEALNGPVSQTVEPHTDNTYAVDRVNGLLYIYAKKFSIYSVGYTVAGQEAPQTHSSSRNDGYSVWPQPTAEPTQTPADVSDTNVTQGQPAASPIKTQQPASPMPFVGLLAGLGAAAVFFGMRRK